MMKFTNTDIETIVKDWFNCHPDAELTEQFAMPLYSVVALCKAVILASRGEE